MGTGVIHYHYDNDSKAKTAKKYFLQMGCKVRGPYDTHGQIAKKNGSFVYSTLEVHYPGNGPRANKGFNKIVRHPTQILVGESGRERVIVKPLTRTSGKKHLSGDRNNVHKVGVTFPGLHPLGGPKKIKSILGKGSIIGGDRIKSPTLRIGYK